MPVRPDRTPLRRRALKRRSGSIAASLSLLAALLAATSVAAGADTAPLAVSGPSTASTEVGAPFFATFTATGGVAPYRWTSTSPLPSGLTLTSKGVLTGIPQTTTSELFVVTATDATGTTSSATLQLVVGAPPVITTTSVPDGDVGVADSFTLSATGGTPPYSWGVSSGPLPLGLVLNSSGVVSGIPAAVGSTTTTFQLIDGVGAHVTAVIRFNVDATTSAAQGYLVATSTGAVSAFASPGLSVAQTSDDGPPQIVGLSADAAGKAYWMTTANGSVIASPATRSFGSVAKNSLVGSIVGIAAKPDGSGYWLTSSTGRVYGFGSARSLGSVARAHLSGSIVGIAADASGTGYWLASSTGRVYGFGSVRRLARVPNARLAGHVVAIASDPVAPGVWVVTNLGQVYGYGGVPTFGSTPRLSRANAAVSLTASPDGLGYWVLTRTGQIRPFGSATLQPAVERGLGGNAVAIVEAR